MKDCIVVVFCRKKSPLRLLLCEFPFEPCVIFLFFFSLFFLLAPVQFLASSVSDSKNHLGELQGTCKTTALDEECCIVILYHL